MRELRLQLPNVLDVNYKHGNTLGGYYDVNSEAHTVTPVININN